MYSDVWNVGSVFIYLLALMSSTTYQPLPSDESTPPATAQQTARSSARKYLIIPILSIIAFTAYKVYQYYSVHPTLPDNQAIDQPVTPPDSSLLLSSSASIAVPTPSPSTEMQGKYSVG